MKHITTKEEFTTLGSAYTITGVGGDLNEWVQGYKDFLSEAGFVQAALDRMVWVTWKGADMNTAFSLTGNNRYQDDLTFLAFELNDYLDISKLAMFKISHGDRWLDDIISNNQRRETEDDAPDFEDSESDEDDN